MTFKMEDEIISNVVSQSEFEKKELIQKKFKGELFQKGNCKRCVKYLLTI